MKLDIRKANRLRFPTVSYTNFRKEFPNIGKDAFNQFIGFQRYWSGRIWNFYFYHHQISLDFRKSPIDDLAFGNVTKQDQKAVDDTIKANNEAVQPKGAE